MTEREWLASNDPDLLYAEVRESLSPEQLRNLCMQVLSADMDLPIASGRGV